MIMVSCYNDPSIFHTLHLPIHARQGQKAALVGEIEKTCAVLQQQTLDHTTGIAKELIPVLSVHGNL